MENYKPNSRTSKSQEKEEPKKEKIEKIVKRNEAKRTEVKKNMRVELGLCYFCGQLSENGYKTCEKHHKIMANNFSKWDRNNNNHYWRQIQGGEVKVVQYKKKLLGVV